VEKDESVFKFSNNYLAQGRRKLCLRPGRVYAVRRTFGKFGDPLVRYLCVREREVLPLGWEAPGRVSVPQTANPGPPGRRL